MNISDLFITPIYLILIYMVGFFFKNRIDDKRIRKYFIPALSLKLFGAIALGLIYQFYYNGGDTFNYYRQSKIIYSAFSDSFIKGVKLLSANGDIQGEIYEYASRIYWFRSPSEYFVIKLSAFFGLFNFHSYTVISLFFAIISFSGLWVLYRTFLKLYPTLYKEFAYAIFFIPSVFFWGSGLLKDTICIGALGWLFYSFYTLFIEKNKIISSTIVLIITVLIIKTIKVYILLSFLPPALLWIFLENSKRIKNKFAKILLAPLLLILGIGSAYYSTTNITKDDKVYALENLAERTKINAEYLYSLSIRDNGSAYNLGTLDGTFKGMIKLAPQAIFVSLFRPFIWEAKNPVMFFSAIEASLFLFFTISIFIKVGFFKSLKRIIKTPILIFCFLFSIVFAFGVGITSYNFGTLVRYKIPLLPFYVSGLFILNHYYLNEKKKKTILIH